MSSGLWSLQLQLKFIYSEKTIFLHKFPKKNIFGFNNFILEENKNIHGNAFIASKSHEQ